MHFTCTIKKMIMVVYVVITSIALGKKHADALFVKVRPKLDMEE